MRRKDKFLSSKIERYYKSKRPYRLNALNLTHFERKVYKAVIKIPFGQTRSYGWVAREVEEPKAARAVAQALKRNPYPLIIPCHRVISSNGSIGGYSQGKGMKEKLLKLERELRDRFKSF